MYYTSVYSITLPYDKKKKTKNLTSNFTHPPHPRYLPLHEKTHPRRQNNNRIRGECFQDIQRAQHDRENQNENLSFHPQRYFFRQARSRKLFVQRKLYKIGTSPNNIKGVRKRLYSSHDFGRTIYLRYRRSVGKKRIHHRRRFHRLCHRSMNDF